MSGRKKNRMTWAALPLYLFTILFVVGPMIYMTALSFASNKGGYGVEWTFKLDNYRQIFQPVYLQTFAQSFQLAISSTLIIMLLGYPFGYFMSKLSEKGKSSL